jgi:hypothetical protein
LNFTQPTLEKTPFGIVSDQRQCQSIAFRGSDYCAKAAQHIRTGSMEQVIVGKIIASGKLIDQIEAGLGTLVHRHGYGAV